MLTFLKSILINSSIHKCIHKNTGEKSQHNRYSLKKGDNPPEKEMATHSSILIQQIPWTEEPGGLQSMGSQSQT